MGHDHGATRLDEVTVTQVSAVWELKHVPISTALAAATLASRTRLTDEVPAVQ